MTYRTKTYIAGDWDNDKEIVDKLYEWKKSNYWTLDFVDAHELTQAKDSSLNCSIKKSLKERLDASKTFVLIVGEHTNSLTKGGCLLWSSYNSWTSHCARNYSVDHRSYVRYECDKAVEADLNIIVIYNAKTVNKNKCPESVRYTGIHVPAFYTGTDGKTYWNYTKIRDAIMN